MSATTDDTDRLTPALLRLAAAVVVGTFVVQMDATMVNVAIVAMGDDFAVDVSAVQWVRTAYLLAMALVIAPTGWAADRFGTRRVWLVALVAFCAGSLACGAAWSVGSLVAFRVVQGACGGMLLPLSQAILAQAAGPRRLGRLMAVVGIPSLLGPVIGPVVGGLLVDGPGWRWIFWINAPICLVAAWLSVRAMPRTAPAVAEPLDVRGLVLLSPALAAIVYGLSEAGGHGSFGGARAVAPVVAGLLLLGAFVVHARRTPRPLVDVRLFASRDFAAGAAMLFLVFAALIGGMLLVPLYLQLARGYTALHAGVLLVPEGLGAAVAIAACGSLVDRFSARPIAVAGAALATLGLLGFTRLGPDTGTGLLTVALVVWGVGFGAAVVPATAAAYRGLAPSAIPRATSGLRIVQQVGASLGVALFAVALQRRLTAAATPEALAHAFGGTFWIAVAFAAAALVPALALSPGRVLEPASEDAASAGR